MQLNIGCGTEDKWIGGTVGLDSIDFGQKYVANILDFTTDEKFSKIYVHHFIEHIQDQISLFNKFWELLEDEGLLDIRVPTLPYFTAFIDPTHVKFIPQNAPDYFRFFTNDSILGYSYSKPFEIISYDRERYEWEAHLIMKKVC